MLFWGSIGVLLMQVTTPGQKLEVLPVFCKAGRLTVLPPEGGTRAFGAATYSESSRMPCAAADAAIPAMQTSQRRCCTNLCRGTMGSALKAL